MSWIVEFEDNSLWDELEAWAWDHNVDVDKLPPQTRGGLFDPGMQLIYRAKLTSWDKNTMLIGKLKWGGRAA